MTHRAGTITVYSAALLTGLTVVAFPASSTVLRAMHGLSDEAYGSLFLPQMGFTILGSLIGAGAARRLGLRRLLTLSMLACAAAGGTLVTVPFVPRAMALPLLLAGTGLMGLGFGLGAGPLNTYPGRLFPERADTALVALHTVIGAGFALGPALVGGLVAAGAWLALPVVITTGTMLVGLMSSRVELPALDSPGSEAARAPRRGERGPLILLCVVAALYALAEGTFSNWAAVYLHDDRGVSESLSPFAISGFWAGLTVGRLGISALLGRVPPERVWLTLPLLMVGVFFLLPLVSGPVTGIGAFVAAGLSSSAFFPLTVAIASKRYPGREATVSSLLTAALMVGVGGGSFLLGALRSSTSLPTLYRVSALYPAVALALGAAVVLRRSAPTLAEETSS